MSAGALLLVVGAVLCALAFAALAVTLMRVRDTLGVLRAEIADLRTSAAEAGETVAAARAELDRFRTLFGPPQEISSITAHSTKLTRTTLSTPMIKAAGLATGTSRAVRRLRRGA